MASLRAPSAGFLSAFLPVARASLFPQQSAALSPIRRRIPLLQHLRTSLLPAALVPIPSLLGEIWEGILKAVPKKKTSHMKKRHRQMAGKGLKDVTALNKCSACGRPKRAHVLCPYCVQSIKRWISTGFKSKHELDAEKDQQYEIYNEERRLKGKMPSKQYLQTHTLADAHPTDIFSLAVTPSQLLSASGSSSIRIHSTKGQAINPESAEDEHPYPLVQTLEKVHPLGCHHVATSGDGRTAASAGFAGELKVWTCTEEGSWEAKGEIKPDKKSAGECWAVALSDDGRALATTTHDGRINVYDTHTLSESGTAEKMVQYETKGSFGLAVDISPNGDMTASGHQNGSVYIFNNTTMRLVHSLTGLIKPVRSVKFSPANKYLAVAGDARIISLYSTESGQQFANLTGHASWIMSLDWNWSGEFLLSGSYDGKAKIWSLERRECVATQTESDNCLWAVKWLPKAAAQRNETFVTAGAGKTLAFYREASGT
ncbi:WD40 repeat-like protein [Hortaea werneckii]|nr:WD40 repeat-like protein [Hortaea werneckii]KAI6865047.1 WD40 repeat-like protein [Hortaea werneckii]KAI7348642.1 WD40 repeat-like protein [Hortaea werneckii]